MPLDNNLNVSELLRRLGVKGDSLGSAPLLESLRLSLQIGDLSNLVPPVPVPLGGASIGQNPGVGNVNKWSLLCRSPGGLVVNTLQSSANNNYRTLITDGLIFGAVVTSAPQLNYASGQNTLSVFRTHTPGVVDLPNFAFELRLLPPGMGIEFQNYVGPGASFNIESIGTNVTETISISWKEYPAGINPG